VIKKQITSKKVLIQYAGQALLSLGNGAISASAYDTAWVARIPRKQQPNLPMFPECLQWIKNHQLADGSWGTKEIRHYYDRVICTLSSLIALKKWDASPQQIERGEKYLQKNLDNLPQEAYATVGFELIFPALIADARALGLDLPYDHPIIKTIEANRAYKLKKIPLDVIYQQPTTVLHSLEGLGPLLDCDRILKQQAQNGSFLNSPSSTAFVYLQTEDEKCLNYIQGLLARFGNFVPVNYPIDVFETLWVLNNIHFLGLDGYFQEEIRVQLTNLKQYWTETGIPWSQYVQVPDLDDTAVMFKLLRLNGEEVSAKVFENFYGGEGFFCFPGEMDSSASHIVNLLEAARLDQGEGILHKAKVYSQDILSQVLTHSKLEDKWLISEDLHSMATYALERSPYQSAPWFDQQERIALYEKLLDNHWIDKVVYSVPAINNADFLELAQLDSWLSSQAFKTELHELQTWARQYLTPNHAIRVLPTHFVACNIALQPEQREARLMFSKITLWLFGTDDFFDADTINLDEINLMVNAFLSESTSLNQFASPTTQDTIHKLRDIIRDLMHQASTAQQRDLSPHLYRMLHDNLSGGIEEALVRINGVPPTFEQYMNYARLTIGVPLVLELTFYMMGHLSDELLQSQEYGDLLTLSSDIIRLLNDVRSYEKELGEGKTNSIGIIMREYDLEHEAAVEYLMEELIEPKMKALHHLVLKPSAIPTNMKALAFDLCRTTAWFYKNNDFHKYTAQMMMQVYGPEEAPVQLFHLLPSLASA
jgi:hypothetical protein